MFIFDFFTKPVVLFYVVFLSVLTVAWFLAYKLKREFAFLCIEVAFFSLWEIFSIFYPILEEKLKLLRASSLLVTAFAYLLLLSINLLKEKIKNRRLEREEKKKVLQFTLPERDNEYIRTRLNTVLKKSENKTEDFFCKEFRFTYIKKLISGLKERSLSPADRLKTEEYAGIISVYTEKENWSLNEMENLNEVLSALLKLSAKYAV